MRLCERFLNSVHGTQEGLDVLKAEVKKTLQAPPPSKGIPKRQVSMAADSSRHGSAARLGKTPSIGRAASGPLPSSRAASGQAPGSRRTTSGSRREATPPGMDWGLPPLFLAQKAHALGNKFGHMTLEQDKMQKADLVQRKANVQKRRAQQRANLDAQMQEKAERDGREQQRRADEAAWLTNELREHAAAEEAAWHANKERQARLNAMYSDQVKEADAMHARQAAADADANLRFMRMVEEKNRQLEAEAQRKREQQKADMIRNQKENEEQMAERRAEHAKRLQAELKMNEEYQKLMDRQQAAREAAVQARHDYMAKAFERGGGAAIERSNTERALREEEYTRRAQEEFNRKREEEAARRLAEAKARQDSADRENASQIRHKMEVRAAERRAAAEEKARLIAQAAADKEAAAAEKRRRVLANEATRAAARQEMVQEAKHRFKEMNEVFDERDAWVHAPVVDRGARGFGTFKDAGEVQLPRPKPRLPL